MAESDTMLLQLRPVGGSMPFAWLSSERATFKKQPMPLLLPLTVSIPATAAPGTYVARVQTHVWGTTIPLTPSTPPVLIFVTVPGNCAAKPTVAVASTQPEEFTVPNGRLADVSVTGRVVVPAGCTIARAWCVLTDEYGIFEEKKDVVTAPDGSFGFTVPVQVSRRGDDRDGRTYRVTVHAADEAGTGSSAAAAVVVRHDQRKEK
jgi:hypothetical protein